MSKKKKEFTSKVTGEVWRKELHGRWNKVIHHTAVLLEECTSVGKNGQITILPLDSKVFIDDIRGRINPQFRVRDLTGKIWFIPVNKLKVLENEQDTRPIDSASHEYRGGVRVSKG